MSAKKKPASPALYTIAAVESLLDVSRATVNRLVRKGELVKVKLGEKSVRITGDSIEAYVARITAEAGG